MSYEHGSADDTVFWLMCAPKMLTRKVKLDDQSRSMADLRRRSPKWHFRPGMITSLFMSVSLGLRYIATGLDNTPNVIQCAFPDLDDGARWNPGRGYQLLQSIVASHLEGCDILSHLT